MNARAARMACIGLLASGLLATGVAGCGREAHGDAATPAPAVAPAADAMAAGGTPVVATETTPAQAGVQPGNDGIDSKAFAGTFEGTLPCADCPGIDERLVLSADGSFELTDVYREHPGSDAALRGSWSVEADGRTLRLDPGSKASVDRLFALDGNDTLLPLGADGSPVDLPGDPRLRRSR